MTGTRYVVGVDVGGTFTDLLVFDEVEGRLLSAKVPSLPGAQWQGVLNALSELEIDFDAVRAFVHGTTIATNALLERKGAKTALVTTNGFRDVLEIGKGRRLTGGLFDTAWQRPKPLVPRDLRHELAERTAADGAILSPAPDDEVESLIAVLRQQGAEAIAVAFVNSYLNPANESAVVAALRRALAIKAVTQSSSLIPERGEFERTSTAVLNAYLTPVMTAYLETLSSELSRHGIRAPVNIMGSNGGAMTLEAAAERCAGTFLSGPVGGVGGAICVAGAAGVRDLISFDMGGTSTDVAMVHDLTPRMSHDNQIDAYPLRMPQLDIHTIGAGGGSIIWAGADGTIQIGPQSAGAVPGPVCYGRGGTQPTISDANLLLGRLPTERPLAGGLRLDARAAERAMRTLGAALGNDDFVALAQAAVAIGVAKMAGAVREVSVHRGFDPRDFTLIAFGGAGPMHGFLVAEELGMSRVLVPRYPGHLSALGQMMADLRRDFVKAWGGRLSEISPAALTTEVEMMQRHASELLGADGIARDRHRHEAAVDMRYVGQSFTLGIPWRLEDRDLQLLRQAFDRRHEETFGYADTANDAEIVNVRLVSIGTIDKPPVTTTSPTEGKLSAGRRRVWFDGWIDTAVYDRAEMLAGLTIEGPVIVEEEGGTTIVPPRWTVRVHESGALLGTRDDPEAR